MKRLNIEKGQRFGKLTVIDEILNSKPRKFVLACDCGNTTEVRLGNLRNEHTNSCGCLLIENGKASKTHGKTGDKVYSCWTNMKTRCFNTDNEAYPEYGGRGISVQSNWVNSFEEFYEFIGDPPSSGKWSVERTDCDGNYEEGNIKWALPPTQNRNRRKFKNNTSGVSGVTCRTRGGQLRYIAIWIDLDGKERSKSFSVKMFGQDAFTLAVKYREDQIARLNAEGADYSVKHGTEGEQINAYDLMDEFGVNYD